MLNDGHGLIDKYLSNIERVYFLREGGDLPAYLKSLFNGIDVVIRSALIARKQSLHHDVFGAVEKENELTVHPGLDDRSASKRDIDHEAGCARI